MRVSSSLIKLIIALSSSALLYACATPSQVYWDNKVKEMCEKDGGVTVYEKVKLTQDEFNKLEIPFKKYAKSDALYYRVSLDDIVINDNPRVWKGGQKIIRKNDEKILGTQIYYGRRGGDISTGVSESSHYGCELVDGVNLNMEKAIFLIN